MKWFRSSAALLIASLMGTATASAQSGSGCSTSGDDCRWSFEVGLGFDNSISGNINSSAIGTINTNTVVITKNRYEDVYGTGLNLRFGGGYMFAPSRELRATFTFQSLDADLVRMGDYGVSPLYGQYTDYQTFGLDLGARQYGNLSERIVGYGEATIGIGFVDKTDLVLVAPAVNFTGKSNDFYDQTAAFTLGFNGGIIVPVNGRLGAFVQMGLRYSTGMADVDDFEGTGLDTVNDDSARWSIPFIVGVRARF